MEIKNKKCSFAKHSEIDAKVICINCNLNLCKECEIFHSNFCKDHQIFSIGKDYKEIFLGYCQEFNHKIKFEYFCRTHNLLCCAKCITKIKNEINGKHTDCDICNIEDIIDEKKKIFDENINILTDLSNTIQISLINIKNIVEKLDKNKEEIKIQIQKSFTKIRNELNNKEDELLLEVDNIYDKTFIKDNLIKEIEKLPKKIKTTLERNQDLNIINNDNDNKDKYISLINDCINLENTIKEFDFIKVKIQNSQNLDNLKIEFISDDEQIIKYIKNFGNFSRNIIPEFLKSSIIKGDYENQNLILDWLKEKINKKDIDFKLIFKMSENGYESSDFHKYCNNKGPTLTFILANDNKKFGGFTPLNWKNDGGFIVDESMKTFIFSLNLNKKYDLFNNDDNAIKLNVDNGPNFGNGDIIIYQNMKGGKLYANDKSSFVKDNNLELIDKKGEQQTINIKEIEVYQVIY